MLAKLRQPKLQDIKGRESLYMYIIALLPLVYTYSLSHTSVEHQWHELIQTTQGLALEVHKMYCTCMI